MEIRVLPVNDPPVAEDDEFFGLEDKIISGNVLENDSDIDGDDIAVNTIPIDAPMNGDLTLNEDGTFIYVPFEDFAGEDAFIYEICDNGSPVACDQAMVSVFIEDVIDPVIVYQAISPNSDSFNDTWIIDGIEQFPNNLVQPVRTDGSRSGDRTPRSVGSDRSRAQRRRVLPSPRARGSSAPFGWGAGLSFGWPAPSALSIGNPRPREVRALCPATRAGGLRSSSG